MKQVVSLDPNYTEVTEGKENTEVTGSMPVS